MIWPLPSSLALPPSQLLVYYALDTGLLTFPETYKGCFYFMAFALLVPFAWNASSVTLFRSLFIRYILRDPPQNP